MNIQELTEYFSHAVADDGPRCVALAVLRDFYLESLCETGQRRAELSLLSDDELGDMWESISVSKDLFDSGPTPYQFARCYGFLMLGIADYGAVKFVVTKTNFQGFDEDNRLVFQPDAELLFFEGQPIDHVSPMYFLGIADEVIRPYICEFHWNRVSTTIAFDLNKEQIREFR